MNIFVCSDESGVFDKFHNRYFVFGGILFLDKEKRDICARKYLRAERTIRDIRHMAVDQEVKASVVCNSDKGKLFRATNNQIRFGVIIDQHRINANIWNNKKDKQRYLDYAYKIAVKRCLEGLINSGRIIPEEVQNLHFYVDEHTTATNGRYELREGLEREFKFGTFNYTWSKFHPPLFPRLISVNLEFCNSRKATLVRAADVIANKIFFYAEKKPEGISQREDLFVTSLP